MFGVEPPVLASGAVAVAAERDVQVVAQPARERDVPATPEVLDGARRVGRVEVHGDLEAEQQGLGDLAEAESVIAKHKALTDKKLQNVKDVTGAGDRISMFEKSVSDLEASLTTAKAQEKAEKKIETAIPQETKTAAPAQPATTQPAP